MPSFAKTEYAPTISISLTSPPPSANDRPYLPSSSNVVIPNFSARANELLTPVRYKTLTAGRFTD